MTYSIQDAILAELSRATNLFPPINNYFEGWAVIEEERAELFDELRRKPSVRSYAAIRMEAIQVAAMVVRLVQDVWSGRPIRIEPAYHGESIETCYGRLAHAWARIDERCVPNDLFDVLLLAGQMIACCDMKIAQGDF